MENREAALDQRIVKRLRRCFGEVNVRTAHIAYAAVIFDNFNNLITFYDQIFHIVD